MSEEKNVSTILQGNMEELLDIAIWDDWSLDTVRTWTLFKIAQFIEQIAYKESEE